MWDQHNLTTIGERFGQQIADVVGGAMARTVTVDSVNEGDGVAMCTVFEGDEALPVPLMLLGVGDATVKVTPTVGTTAVIGMLNGDRNRPYFISILQVDKYTFTRSTTTLTWSVDPEDKEKDEIAFELGKTKANVNKDGFNVENDKASVNVNKDEVNVAFDKSVIRLDKDVIEMNGGELGSLVVIGKLTERLNKMQSEIDQIQSAISSHTHTVATTGGPTAQTGSTTATTYAKVQLTQVKDGDYENTKITQ